MVGFSVLIKSLRVTSLFLLPSPLQLQEMIIIILKRAFYYHILMVH
jgi:hypothetical protein